MFEAKLWAWQFSRYETKGVGHAIAELEADKAGKDNLVLDVLGVHDDKVRELSRAIVTAGQQGVDGSKSEISGWWLWGHRKGVVGNVMWTLIGSKSC
jgi:hypothetical protein